MWLFPCPALCSKPSLFLPEWSIYQCLRRHQIPLLPSISSGGKSQSDGIHNILETSLALCMKVPLGISPVMRGMHTDSLDYPFLWNQTASSKIPPHPALLWVGFKIMNWPTSVSKSKQCKLLPNGHACSIHPFASSTSVLTSLTHGDSREQTDLSQATGKGVAADFPSK